MLTDMLIGRVDFREPSGRLDLARRAGDFFSRIPYENVTKIVRHHRCPARGIRMRSPEEVLTDHLLHGAGGTCFSLTWTLVSLLRELGVSCQPALADRGGGPDGHCAVLVEEEGSLWLLDPGYLITSPLRLDPSSTVVLSRDLNDVKVTPGSGGTFRVSTADSRGERWRYTLKTDEVSHRSLRGPWSATFGGPSTRSLVLTRLCESGQLYYHGRQLLWITREGKTTEEVPPEMTSTVVSRHFGIRRRLVDESLECLAASR